MNGINNKNSIIKEREEEEQQEQQQQELSSVQNINEINSNNSPFKFISNMLKKGENMLTSITNNNPNSNNKYDKFRHLYYNDLLPSGNFDSTAEFLQKIFEIMIKHVQTTNNRKEKILNFEYPHDLKRHLNLDICKDPKSIDQIILDCDLVCEHAVKTGHPRFFNQLSQGLDVVSLAGECITAVTNTNMFTYEIAPLYNLIEEVTLTKMMQIIGWNVETEGDGIFNPGGSISNLYAVQMAKHFHFPDTKTNGLFQMPKITIFTSAHSHYSIERAVAILGIGINQVKLVPVDKRGKLIPSKLEEMIKKSLNDKEKPFMVALTAGTTVLGAFDPIDQVSLICKKYNLWLHVDAAWGGGALLSQKHRHLLNGIEKADSVTWNPHKLMGSLLQCSAFLVRHKGVLLSCNEMHATYLFQQDKHYDVRYDTGDKTIQCGRHVDVFKCWLMWRAKGDCGFEKQIDRLFDLANLLEEQCKMRENFELVFSDDGLKHEFVNICFWYIPPSLKKEYTSTNWRNSREFKEKLNRIAPQIKERMMMKGSLMVGYQPLDDLPNFFRAIISNPASNEDDIIFMLDEIERLGSDL